MIKFLSVFVFVFLIFGSALKSAAFIKIDKQPIEQALKVLPEEYKIPEDRIKYVDPRIDFRDQGNSEEWIDNLSHKLAFYFPGESSIYVNINALTLDGKEGQDPYHAAINWRKMGMPISPATYILASVLVHEYYGHGPGCTETVKACKDEARALRIEQAVYEGFFKNQLFDEINKKARFNPENWNRNTSALIAKYENAAVAVK